MTSQFILIFAFLLTFSETSSKLTYDLVGDWYSCGIRTLELDQTVTFKRDSLNCMEQECLVYAWTFDQNNLFNRKWVEGCSDEKIGYDFTKKQKWKWNIDEKRNIIQLSFKSESEVYQIKLVSQNSLTVKRIR